MANAVKLKELLTNINGRFDSIEFDSRAGRILIEQEQNKDMKSIAEIDSITRWIENNCADGLIDSMPLVDQINSIYERQLGKAEKAKRQLTSERALADRLAALLQRNRDLYGGQQVDPQCGCWDCEYLRPIDDALTAWKEARGEVKEAKEH